MEISKLDAPFIECKHILSVVEYILLLKTKVTCFHKLMLVIGLDFIFYFPQYFIKSWALLHLPLLSKSWARRNLWGSTVKLKVWLEVRYPKREGSKRSQEKWVLKISYKTWKLAIISLVTVTDFIFCKNKLSWKFSNWLELTCKS